MASMVVLRGYGWRGVGPSVPKVPGSRNSTQDKGSAGPAARTRCGHTDTGSGAGRRAVRYSGAAAASTAAPASIAVDTDVASASAVRISPPAAPAGCAIIEFNEITLLR